jgi:predicted transcriptional regulator
MSARVDSEVTLKLACEIVVAYLTHSSIEPAALPGLVRAVRASLEDSPLPMIESAASAPPLADGAVVSGLRSPDAPAVPVEASVTREYLVSLEDGKRYRSLRRHLMAKYGMTPEDYRRKWNLPADYPMVAPSYAEERSAVAKRIGLGKGAKTPPDPEDKMQTGVADATARASAKRRNRG